MQEVQNHFATTAFPNEDAPANTSDFIHLLTPLYFMILAFRQIAFSAREFVAQGFLMQTFEIDRSQDIPLVTSRIYGPSGTRRVQLVFDTGAAKTQFHTPVLESIGYSASQAIHMLTMSGPAGPG